MRYISLFASCLFFAIPSVFAASGLGSVADSASWLCVQLTLLLPIVAMLMILASATIYASGQLMGAETRARATTWATAMLIGALISILIVVVLPKLLSLIFTCIDCDPGPELVGAAGC